MSVVTEIGPDLYRISVYVPQFDLQFNLVGVWADVYFASRMGGRRCV